MSLQKRQVKWSWALFSVGPPVRYAHSMAECPVTLSRGQFFGARFQTIHTHSFVCAEREATGSARELPRHSHASSHFVLVVRGMYITEAGNQDRLYGPGRLIYNPIGTTHRDRFHNGCGRFLTITPSATVARMLDARSPVSLVIHQPGAIAAAARTRTPIGFRSPGRAYCGRRS
jgi:AraC family transcriptional regulator